MGVIFPICSLYWIYSNFNFASMVTFLIATWFVGINTTIFAHRAWTHKSWNPGKVLNLFGLFLFTITAIGNSVGWVSVHREHHRYSDTEKDPHSPLYKSRWKIQFLPYFNKVQVQYVVDLARDRTHVWFAKYYWYVIIAWYGCLYIIDPELLLFWIAVTGLSAMKMLSINSLGHNTPKWLLPVDGNSQSSNSLVLALLNINNGEAWHRNHHEDPNNWNFGKKWYEIDPAAWLIRLYVITKLAKISRD